ncbi:MAG: GGDEF domain-containing protein [Deltaproteobacteria bacterium]|nr:GGDEF domain-containing protein [Deltaproteobacteria bacterium]
MFFKSFLTESSRKKLLIAFTLSSILPLLIMIAIIFHFVLPQLNSVQIKALNDVFSIGVLAMICLLVAGLFFLFSVIRALEDLTSEIATKTRQMVTKESLHIKNEMVSLHNIFDRLYKDLEDKVKKLDKSSRDLIQLNIKLSKDAITDELTSLYNRRFFYVRLAEDIARLEEYNPELTVMMLDIDNFKYFNEKYGHQTGDKILKDISQVFRDVARKSDSCFRYGGDEFAVILPSCDAKCAEVLAGKLIKTVSDTSFENDNGNVFEQVTVSCGIAEYRVGKSAEDFVEEVDQWLHTAKAAGKNRVELAVQSA